MENSTRRDPLLTTAKVVLLIVQGVLAFGGAAMAIAIPVLLFSRSHVEEHLLPGASGHAGAVMSAIVTILLLAIVVFALVFHFVQLLSRIIGTVGDGDPFIPINAERLARMGWVTLIIQGVAIPMAVLTTFLRSQFPKGAVHIESVFSLNGLVLAMVLFILARVFRKGTEMREDLEGTV
jgi:hypothetical protein